MTAPLLLAAIQHCPPFRRALARALTWKLGADYDWSIPRSPEEMAVEAWLLDLHDDSHERFTRRKAPR